MPDPFVLHIGFPGAGSTALQSVFAALDHVTYLGKDNRYGRRGAVKGRAGIWARPEFGTFVSEIASLYDARAVDCQPFRAAFDGVLTQSAGQSVLLSDETLSSLSVSLRGGGASIPQVLENFRAVVEAPITAVLVIREQQGLLKSLYAQMVKGGYPNRFDAFIATILTKAQYWAAPVLDYTRTIPLLRAFCDRAVVIPFERMAADDRYRAATFAGLLGEGPGFDTLPRILTARDAVPVARWLDGNRAGRGWLTIPPTRYLDGDLVARVDRAAADPVLLRLQGAARRQKREIADWAAARRAAPGKPPCTEEAFALTDAVSDHLQDTVRGWNAGLGSLLPEHDWAALGYLT